MTIMFVAACHMSRSSYKEAVGSQSLQANHRQITAGQIQGPP
jgi:hypothetical protein